MAHGLLTIMMWVARIGVACSDMLPHDTNMINMEELGKRASPYFTQVVQAP